MPRDVIPPGTLDLLILRTLALSTEMHGYEIAKVIRRRSGDVLKIEEGSLYPALQRMRHKGWLKAQWATSPGNHRARYYRLTPAGKEHLEKEIARFDRTMEAISRVLQPE